jgi:hypothetical protein
MVVCAAGRLSRHSMAQVKSHLVVGMEIAARWVSVVAGRLWIQVGQKHQEQLRAFVPS